MTMKVHVCRDKYAVYPAYYVVVDGHPLDGTFHSQRAARKTAEKFAWAYNLLIQTAADAPFSKAFGYGGLTTRLLFPVLTWS